MQQQTACAADTRWSAIGLAITTPIVLAWMLTYMIGFDSVFPASFIDKVDINKVDLKKWGWFV